MFELLTYKCTSALNCIYFSKFCIIFMLFINLMFFVALKRSCRCSEEEARRLVPCGSAAQVQFWWL